jgi:hypothetical protein
VQEAEQLRDALRKEQETREGELAAHAAERQMHLDDTAALDAQVFAGDV